MKKTNIWESRKNQMTKLKDNAIMIYETDYEKECLRILKKYPDEMKQIFSYEQCELGHDFLGFLDEYQIEVPKEYIVIDFGCCQAVQAQYFKEQKAYIGIDNGIPNQYRFPQKNAIYYEMDIVTYIKQELPRLIAAGTDLTKIYVICSYVPDKEAQQLVMDTFPYCRVVYCEEILADRRPPVLDFYNCIRLLDLCANTRLIQKDLKDKDSILVYRQKGEKTEEGWYREKLMDAARELLSDGNGQRYLVHELKNRVGVTFKKEDFRTFVQSAVFEDEQQNRKEKNVQQESPYPKKITLEEHTLEMTEQEEEGLER